MTKEEIIEMAQRCGLFGIRPYPDGTYSEALEDFAKLVAEKAIEPYLPYKQHIETMERAFDAHFKKARGQE